MVPVQPELPRLGDLDGALTPTLALKPCAMEYSNAPLPPSAGDKLYVWSLPADMLFDEFKAA